MDKLHYKWFLVLVHTKMCGAGHFTTRVVNWESELVLFIFLYLMIQNYLDLYQFLMREVLASPKI